MSIKLGSASSKPKTGGFKKGGFKNAFGPVDDTVDEVKKEVQEDDTFGKIGKAEVDQVEEDSDLTDQEDYYDPARPTGCTPGCPGFTT